MKNIIVAHDREGVIGANNAMPWEGELPADMRHFRALTLGHAVIMGRNTFESIGRPLPKRENIVLSNQPDLVIEGCTVVHSLDEAYEVTQNHNEVFVIGGAKVYQLAMPTVDRLHVTEIAASFEGDARFVSIDPEVWERVSTEDHMADEKNKYNYRFVTYERRIR